MNYKANEKFEQIPSYCGNSEYNHAILVRILGLIDYCLYSLKPKVSKTTRNEFTINLCTLQANHIIQASHELPESQFISEHFIKFLICLRYLFHEMSGLSLANHKIMLFLLIIKGNCMGKY